MTTIGTWTAAAMPTARSASETSRRQLNCPSRSSQTGTIALASDARRSGSTPSTVTAAWVTARTKATTGIAANSPTIPASAAPAGRAMSASAGWMSTVL